MFKPFIFLLLLAGLSAHGFIIGGQDVLDNRTYPFIVKLSNNCAGMIIDKSWVLTAGHCNQGVSAVIAGEHKRENMSNMSPKSYAQLRHPVKWIVHRQMKLKEGKSTIIAKNDPNFLTEENDTTVYENDLMLLKVNKPFDLSVENVSSIKLASIMDSKNYLVNNEVLKVIGWGVTKERRWQEDRANTLQELEVPFIPSVNSNVEESYYGLINDKNMITAGFMAGLKDSCGGDSGGPLFKETNEGPVLMGVVSSGRGCAQKNKPGIYVKVSSALSWIKTTIESEYECIIKGQKFNIYFGEGHDLKAPSSFLASYIKKGSYAELSTDEVKKIGFNYKYTKRGFRYYTRNSDDKVIKFNPSTQEIDITLEKSLFSKKSFSCHKGNTKKYKSQIKGM